MVPRLLGSERGNAASGAVTFPLLASTHYAGRRKRRKREQGKEEGGEEEQKPTYSLPVHFPVRRRRIALIFIF